MDEARKTGLWGEILAVRALRDKGWRIVNTNFRVGRTETDIIAEDGDRLVCVEVKTRNPDALLPPAEAVDVDKQRNLKRAGAAIGKIYKAEKPVRFDIIEVYYTDPTQYKINHIENAF
ncbi:MAG: YraN family protein [Clostridia bacterium]|nr:YraN family protein [Clostridia bacterium]MBR5427183.1 YraN family protein [Clostridia bacterium]